MSNTIYVKFPKKFKHKLPRQRACHLGEFYAGPPLCQSLEKYDHDDLLSALESILFVDEVNIDDLLEMGWYHRGDVFKYLPNIRGNKK